MPGMPGMSSMSPADNIHTVSETQANFISDRIQNVERYFGLMCKGAALIARKHAKCRDAMDDLARVIVAYTDTETLNIYMRNQVTQLADIMCGIADVQQVLVEKLEMKIVGGFSTYRDACRYAKGDLASTFKAQAREIETSHKLEAMRATGPANYRQIALAETELQRAAIDVARTHAALEESMEYFEMKKLRDLRRFLLEFVHSKLNYHARNIELYTRAYRMVKDMDVDTDLDDFRRAMQFPVPPSAIRKHASDLLSQSSAAQLSPSRKSSTAAGSPRSTPRYAAGNENSPYNQRTRSRSMDCDREPAARLRVQSRPRISDNDVFQHSYAAGSRDRVAARPSRSRSS